MPEFNVEVEFEVYCGTCGEGLCSQTEVVDESYHNKKRAIKVDACDKCLEAAKDSGKDEGYQEGYNDKEKEIAEEGGGGQ